MTDDTRISFDIEQPLRSLEQLGLVRRTGEFRDGKPVDEAVKLGLLTDQVTALALRRTSSISQSFIAW
jgi:hypothetical protein